MDEKTLLDAEMMKLRELVAAGALEMALETTYPIRLILKPASELYGQVSMMEDRKEPEQPTVMVLSFMAGEISLKIIGHMRIDDDLYTKIRTRFRKVAWYYLAWLHSQSTERNEHDA